MNAVQRSGRVLMITLKKSWIKKGVRVQRALLALGFKRRMQTIAKPDTPFIRGHIWRCRHILEVKAEDATSILKSGESLHFPLALKEIPLTKELLDDNRKKLKVGLQKYRYLKSRKYHLKKQLQEAKAKAHKALQPAGYPLHPPLPTPNVLEVKHGLRSNKTIRRLPISMVVKPVRLKNAPKR
uniref:Large ribosomal subunit protein uL30-like ferredoxin-like fold domain-containing protein n=1 Tax=Eutreptiella gymnastica TaxID=73025 RepID=A0A7S1N7Q7_9EUGL|mmetsp:Transcript_132834/g.230322  ORF Transcript_132834/g.230322 Transcript_132834/m.230322 type:complete len:183 (+) Transcript_132834:79-627(+)